MCIVPALSFGGEILSNQLGLTLSCRVCVCDSVHNALGGENEREREREREREGGGREENADVQTYQK